jgi:peptide/nickel transport system substrate-binding protein
MKAPILGLCRLVTAFTLLSSMSLPVSAIQHPWTQVGTLRVALLNAPNTLNPMMATENAEGLLLGLVFDGLLNTHPDGSVEPGLASPVPSPENGGISKDGRTVTYHLRRNVLWQDGMQFTSADVAFTQRALMNPLNNVVDHQGGDLVERIGTPNPYTVVVHLKRAFAPFIAEWESAVLPAHLLEGSRDLNRSAFNGAPIGTGPFKLQRWVRGGELTFTANEAYFGGKPKSKRIVVKVIPDDSSAVLALKTHDVDWVYLASSRSAKELFGDPNIRVVRMRANQYRGLQINVTHPPLDDKRVRRALVYGIDRDSLARKVGGEFVEPAIADLPSFMWAADPSRRAAPYDPSKARALLASAGWRPGSNGIATKDGKSLSLLLTYAAGNSSGESVGIQAQSMLRAIGVDIAVKAVQPNVLFAPASMNGVLLTGRFDIAYGGLSGYDDPDNSRSFSCATVAPGGFNVSRWCNSRYEAANRVAVGHYDRATRKRAYAEIERILLEDVPVIFLWWPYNLQLMSVDVTGIVSLHGDLASANNWES